MPWYGDHILEHLSIPLDSRKHRDVNRHSQIILRATASLVGADGRQVKGNDDELASNHIQKIFPVVDGNSQLTCMLLMWQPPIYGR